MCASVLADDLYLSLILSKTNFQTRCRLACVNTTLNAAATTACIQDITQCLPARHQQAEADRAAIRRAQGFFQWLKNTKIVQQAVEGVIVSQLYARLEQLSVFGAAGAAGIGRIPIACDLRELHMPQLARLVLRNVGLHPSSPGQGGWFEAIHREAPNLTSLEIDDCRLLSYSPDDHHAEHASYIAFDITACRNEMPFTALTRLRIRRLSMALNHELYEDDNPFTKSASMLLRADLLSGLTLLTHLTVGAVGAALVQQVSCLTNLQELGFDLLPDTQSSNLEGLQQLQKLSSLSVRHACVVFTSHVLSGLTGLQQLTMHDCVGLEPAALQGMSLLVHLSLTEVPLTSSDVQGAGQHGSDALLAFVRGQTRLTHIVIREPSSHTEQGRQAQLRAALTDACLTRYDMEELFPDPDVGYSANRLPAPRLFAALPQCTELQHLQLSLPVTPITQKPVYWEHMFGHMQNSRLPHLTVLELTVPGAAHAAGLDPKYGFSCAQPSHGGKGDRGSLWALGACCPALQRLALTGVLKSDETLEALAPQQLPCLRSLCVSGISDIAISSSIKFMEKLTELRLHQPHKISWQALAQLACLTRLHVLEVNANINGTYKKFALRCKVCA